MTQKIFSCEASETLDINKLINDGWIVKNMIPECVSVSTDDRHGYVVKRGLIVYLLEKP